MLTASESTASLKAMADSLEKQVWNQLRFCIQTGIVVVIRRVSPDSILCLEVRLDIFHFMRRLAAGCNGESALCMVCLWLDWQGVFSSGMQMMFLCCLGLNGGELQKAGVVNPSEDTVRKAVTKEEMARHCRRQTRGVVETCKLLDSFFPACPLVQMPLEWHYSGMTC